MKAAIICVGTELVSGLVQDKNAFYLSHNLVAEKIIPQLILFVPDQKETIIQSLQFAFAQPEVQLVIVSGGLGPTEDDLTREAIAEFVQKPLVFVTEAWERICSFYQKIRGVAPPPNNERQAYFPEGATILYNQMGTAPAFKVDFKDKRIYVIPGVPQEANFFWEKIKAEIQPEASSFYRTKIIKLIGIGESDLEQKIKPFLSPLPPKLKPAFLPRDGEIWFYISGDSVAPEEEKVALSVIARLEQELKKYLFSSYGNSPEEAIGNLLLRLNARLAVAESCSGGLLGHRITNVPGSSNYFERGLIVYSNQSKEEELAIPQGVLSREGAVSEVVARLLAENIRKKAKTDYGIGITGIAGPTGATPQKPVGLVYIGLADSQTTRVERFQFMGDRETVKKRTTQSALFMLFSLLREKIENGF